MGRPWNGRQQLLSRNPRSGQALVELLPAMVLLFSIVVAAYSFFEVSRAAVLRQEVVRNLAFRSIANMGSLTTPPHFMSNYLGDPNEAPQPTGLQNSPVFQNTELFMSSQGQVPVTANTRCFTLFPKERVRQIPVKVPGFAGGAEDGGVEMVVQMQNYAVVQRLPGGNCF